MYLKDCKTLDELKAAYRKWTKKLHPDCGGTDAEMKALNLEYEQMFEALKCKHNATADAAHQTTETARDFMDIIEKLIRMEGVLVEQCGSWLWLSGNTYPHRTELREAGCRWSSSKKRWYWRSPEEAYSKKHKAVDMEDIRNKYGSQIYGATTASRPALA